MLDFSATALVAVAAGLFIWAQVEARWIRKPQPPQVQDVKGVVLQASTLRNVKGSGLVALVEFTDYECPFCGAYARETAPAVDKMVDSGTLRHVVFNFPLEKIHPNARRAAEAAECSARQGRYWEMHWRLFRDRNRLDEESIGEAVEALGLDKGKFKQCASGESSEQITKDIAEGFRLGVKGTPTFFVGTVQADGSIKLIKRFSGAAPLDYIKRVVDDVRRMAKPS